MQVLIWLAMGGAAGLLMQWALVENWRTGIHGTVILGAVGAVGFSWALRLVGLGAPGIHIDGLIIAFCGAAGLLWLRRRALVQARGRG